MTKSEILWMALSGTVAFVVMLFGVYELAGPAWTKIVAGGVWLLSQEVRFYIWRYRGRPIIEQVGEPA